MVQSSVNVNAVNFGGLGPTLASNPTAFVQPLFSVAGTAIINENTAPTTGQIIGFNPYSFGVFPPGFVPAGDYKIGYACSTPTGVVDSFYQTIVRVTTNTTAAGGPGQFTWTTNIPADAPGTPTGVAATPGAASATVTFTPAPSGPGVGTATSFVVTAVPAGGGAPITVSGAASPLTLTGLTNGTAYAVTVVATNSGGSSAPSSPAVNVTPVPDDQPPVVMPPLTPGIGQVTINIPAVVVGGARTVLPTSYTLTVSPAPPSGPATFTIPFAAGPLTQVVPCTAGTPYTFTLTVIYPVPNNGAGSVVTGTCNNAQVVQQRITVTRPVGQLILTQRCGVNGAMPALAADAGFPGFPSALPLVAASAGQVGTSPDITPNGVFPTGAGLFADAVTADPQFANYPYPSPATYPTECGVNLGTAAIVNSGPLAGQYFQADGFINEVTVSDARDTDLGWEVRGQMSDFVGTTSNTNIIDGDYLGWTPYVQNTTPTTGTGYTQTVAPGAQVLPGTGVVSGSGLGSGRRLSIATENLGLGIAQMDARLRMLIPLASNNDVYTGILNFTVLDNDNGTTP